MPAITMPRATAEAVKSSQPKNDNGTPYTSSSVRQMRALGVI